MRNDNSLLECAAVTNLPGHVTDDEEQEEPDDDQPKSKKPRVCNGKRTVLAGKRTEKVRKTYNSYKFPYFREAQHPRMSQMFQMMQMTTMRETMMTTPEGQRL